MDVWTIKIYIPLSDFAGHTHSCPKDYGGKIFLKFSKKFLYYDKNVSQIRFINDF